MGDPTDDARPDLKATALAEAQHGCLARQQLGDLGFTDRMIQRRVTTGRWHRRHPGVYRLSGLPTSWIDDLWAAVLAVGSHAVVSRESALLLRGSVTDARVPRQPLHLTVPHGQHCRVARAVVHQIDDLRPEHYTMLDGLAVSTVERAVVDMAATFGERQLGDVIDDLVVARATTLVSLGRCLAGITRPGKPGATKLARSLDARGHGYVPPHSELERHMFDALSTAGLPPPRRQLALPGRGAVLGTVDAGYVDVRMLLEADGRRWHSRMRDLRRDHERDAEAARAGWVTLRFMYEQLVSAPAEVAATVADVRRTRLAQLAHGPADPNLRQ